MVRFYNELESDHLRTFHKADSPKTRGRWGRRSQSPSQFLEPSREASLKTRQERLGDTSGAFPAPRATEMERHGECSTYPKDRIARASEMAQWSEVLATKTDGLSSIPQAHTTEENNQVVL